MFLNVINKTIPLNKKRQISPCKWKNRGFRDIAHDPDRTRKHPCKGLVMIEDKSPLHIRASGSIIYSLHNEKGAWKG